MRNSFFLSYSCNLTCDHCSLYSSPTSKRDNDHGTDPDGAVQICQGLSMGNCRRITQHASLTLILEGALNFASAKSTGDVAAGTSLSRRGAEQLPEYLHGNRVNQLDNFN